MISLSVFQVTSMDSEHGLNFEANGYGFVYQLTVIFPGGHRVGFPLPLDNNDLELLRNYTGGTMHVPVKRGGYEYQWWFERNDSGGFLLAFGELINVRIDLNSEQAKNVSDLLLATPKESSDE